MVPKYSTEVNVRGYRPAQLGMTACVCWALYNSPLRHLVFNMRVCVWSFDYENHISLATS